MRKNTTSSFSETRNRANQSAIELIRCKTKESTNNTPKQELAYNKWFIKPKNRLKRSVPRLNIDKTCTKLKIKVPNSTINNYLSNNIQILNVPLNELPVKS